MEYLFWNGYMIGGTHIFLSYLLIPSHVIKVIECWNNGYEIFGQMVTLEISVILVFITTGMIEISTGVRYFRGYEPQ